MIQYLAFHFRGKQLYLFTLALLEAVYAQSQGIQLSQFYNLVQFHNPAFVGTACGLRATLHSRLQWPGLDARYTTGVAAFDYNFVKQRSGIGLMLLQDVHGDAVIKTQMATMQYAYMVPLSEKVSMRAGVNASLVRRTLNNALLYYPKDFTGAGFNQGEATPLSRNNIDIGAGFLLFTKSFWVGLGGTHLNMPNQSFIDRKEYLPRRYNLIAGYKITIKKAASMRYLQTVGQSIVSISPSVLYKWQGKSDQLEVGMFAAIHQFKAGTWYRGLLIKNYRPKEYNNESMVAMVGIGLYNLSFNYSFDFTLSQLGHYSRGSHEMNIIYILPESLMRRQRVKYKRLPCPGFYGL